MYDLEDLNMWEPVLYGAPLKKREQENNENKMMSKMNKDEEVRVCFCVCLHFCKCVYVHNSPLVRL